MKTTYCYVAAKSAGHILPALALARETKQLNPAAQILFVSTSTDLDQKLLKNNNDITHIQYTLTNIPYQRPWRLPIFGSQLLCSFYKSYTLLRRVRPQRIVSTGGLIALPVCISAWLLSIPIDLYELNAEPGSAIRWLSKLATHVYYCFEETARELPEKKRKQTSYPLYSSLETAAATHDLLHFDKTKKTIFILGGSQGSVTLNHAIKQALIRDHTLASSVNIIHQMGAMTEQLNQWRSWYTKNGIPAYVFSYESTCVPYYKLADLIICRSGAGTLFELEALKKRSITIPLETKSTHHQVTNAIAITRKYPQLIKLVRQHELESGNFFVEKITECLE